MILLLDFDGVFVSLNPFWKVLDVYSKEKKIILDDTVKDEIKKSIVKNQNELNLTFLKYGIDDLRYLNELYLNEIALNQDAENFLKFCNRNRLRYLFYSGASPERITHTFLKYNIRFNSTEIIFANSKSEQEISDLKLQLLSEYGPNDFAYVDDYPAALKAAKKNDFTTILMNETIASPKKRDNRDYIDYRVNSFSELEKVVTVLIGG
jgi:beta-phosphoglucomutase-like phosphatase (HAD superfamily)